MNEPMPGIYRKQFANRYEHAREQQILEYLGQRHGPVPPLVLSHAEDGYLDMHHGGTNLHQWLTAKQVDRTKALQVMADALSALMTTAQLEVWHVDIALRNFVIQNQGTQGRPRVWLIDFGNAICPHYALQKPLWMLPHADQHPELQKALIQDWQAFYKRHNLPQLSDWHAPFEVSKVIYERDWSSGLKVESVALRWCITAHGVGKMWLKAAPLIPGCPNFLQDHFLDLMELQNEADASARLSTCLNALQNASSSSTDSVDANQTPRPRMASRKPNPQPPPIITTPLEVLRTTPERIKPLKLQPVSDAPMHKVSRVWLGGVSAVCMASGWWVLDVAYTAQGQAISVLTMVVAGLAVLSWGVGIIGWFKAPHTSSRWIGALWVQAAGQGVLALELWAFGMPVGTLWAMGLAPAIGLLALLFI